MTMNLFHSLWTIVVLITFIGIIAWSYSKNRKSDFEAAANLALEDHFPISVDNSTNDAINDVTHDEKKQEQSNV
jgi:cytochrome c oxidase cbb3-type subunit 4